MGCNGSKEKSSSHVPDATRQEITKNVQRILAEHPVFNMVLPYIVAARHEADTTLPADRLTVMIIADGEPLNTLAGVPEAVQECEQSMNNIINDMKKEARCETYPKMNQVERVERMERFEKWEKSVTDAKGDANLPRKLVLGCVSSIFDAEVKRVINLVVKKELNIEEEDGDRSPRSMSSTVAYGSPGGPDGDNLITLRLTRPAKTTPWGLTTVSPINPMVLLGVASQAVPAAAAPGMSELLQRSAFPLLIRSINHHPVSSPDDAKTHIFAADTEMLVVLQEHAGYDIPSQQSGELPFILQPPAVIGDTSIMLPIVGSSPNIPEGTILCQINYESVATAEEANDVLLNHDAVSKVVGFPPVDTRQVQAAEQRSQQQADGETAAHQPRSAVVVQDGATSRSAATHHHEHHNQEHTMTAEEEHYEPAKHNNQQGVSPAMVVVETADEGDGYEQQEDGATVVVESETAEGGEDDDEWIHCDDNPEFSYSAQQDLFYHYDSGWYYDGNSNMWYDPDTGEWSEA